MPPSVPFDDIAMFVGLSEHTSFRSAARALGIPKSTLSRRIALLEEQLGALLLHRTGKTIQLTEAGATLRARCLSPLEQMQSAAGSVSRTTTAQAGPIRVAMPNDFGTHVCAPLLLPFLQQHPEISIALECADRRVDLIREGFDLAIRVGALTDPDLIAKRLGRIAGALVASPAYLLRQGTPRSPDDLRSHACIVFTSPAFKKQWELRGPQRALRSVEVSGPLASNRLTTVRDAALAGLGIARLPLYVCAQELESQQLIRVLPDWAGEERAVYVVYPNRRHLPTRVRLLLQYLTRRAAEGRLSPSLSAGR